jgi:hypothetical protein
VKIKTGFTVYKIIDNYIDLPMRPINDRFVLSEKPVENRQSTNLCKSNLSAIPAEVSRMDIKIHIL